MGTAMYDKTGRQIMPGDLLKVYHFRSGKGHHYIYKHVLGEYTYGGRKYLRISHLNLDYDDARLLVDDAVRPDIEIVQGNNGGVDYLDRPITQLPGEAL